MSQNSEPQFTAISEQISRNDEQPGKAPKRNLGAEPKQPSDPDGSKFSRARKRSKARGETGVFPEDAKMEQAKLEEDDERYFQADDESVQRFVKTCHSQILMI